MVTYYGSLLIWGRGEGADVRRAKYLVRDGRIFRHSDLYRLVFAFIDSNGHENNLHRNQRFLQVFG